MTIKPFIDRWENNNFFTSSTGNISGLSHVTIGRYNMERPARSGSLSKFNNSFSGSFVPSLNKFLQGIYVTDLNFRAGNLKKITDEGFTQTSYSHRLVPNHWGQPKIFRDDTPYEDMDNLKMSSRSVGGIEQAYGGVISYMEDKKQTLQYPIILFSPSFRDPYQMDGVIEPFSLREVITTTSPDSPFVAHRVSAELLDGTIETEKGCARMTQRIHRKSGSQGDPFQDSQELFSNKSEISPGPIAPPLALMGLSSDWTRLDDPFDDSRSIKEKNVIIKINIGTVLQSDATPTLARLAHSASSDLGIVNFIYKSATAGFVYENNSDPSGILLGTDSLAFGGWKKRGKN